MFTIACCLVAGLRLRLGLGLDLVSGCTRICATNVVTVTDCKKTGAYDEISSDIGALDMWISLLVHRQRLVVHMCFFVVAHEKRANH